METYLTIAKDGQYEIDIKKSRFICHIKRVTSTEEAQVFIDQIKKENYKANHNCSAFQLGEKFETKRMSDDGEPSGTAGVPILTVLETRQLQNVVAVVTRYFGGTKLGAGGLIRAYSNSTSEAIDYLGVVKGELNQELSITINYAQLGTVQNYCENQSIIIDHIEYGEVVALQIFIPSTQATKLQTALTNLLNGSLQITLGIQEFREHSITFEEEINYRKSLDQ